MKEEDDNPSEHHHLTQYMQLIRYKNRICVGSARNWRHVIIQELHASNLGRHSGVIATYQRVKKSFYWPKFRNDIHHFINLCEVCQLNKPEHIYTPGLLKSLPIPERAWSSIGMDFITGLTKSDGKEVILVIVD